MKIFLTGGTGFIGSHFLYHSFSDSHEVLALRRNSGSEPKIKLASQPTWINAGLDEISAEQMKGSEVLVHLAAHTGNIPYDSLLNCLQWNLVAVLKLFEQARLAGIKRYVVAGSCFEYGKSADRYKEIPTNAPLEPTNSYATSKAAASTALLQWAHQHSLDIEILRIFHVFGEGEAPSRFWPSLRHAALTGQNFAMTGGMQIRDCQPVEDVARVFLERCLLPRNTVATQQVFNLASGNPCSILEFASQCWKGWCAAGVLQPGLVEYRKSEVMRYVPGCNKLSLTKMNRKP